MRIALLPWALDFHFPNQLFVCFAACFHLKSIRNWVADNTGQEFCLCLVGISFRKVEHSERLRNRSEYRRVGEEATGTDPTTESERESVRV